METLQRTANRGSISTGYEIDNSLKFEEDNTERLEVTFSSEGDRRTFTYSFWHKRTELGRNQMVFSAGDTYIYFDSNDAIAINFRNEVAVNYFKITNAKYRDISAWYHVVVRCDTTQGTAADRSKLWVNGEEVTSFSLNQADNMSLNHQTSMNDNITHMIGAPSNNTTTYKLSGYLSEFHHVDGQALSPTDFGEYDDDSGIWKPKEYTGTYGTNGFFLEFKNAASVGADTSGNGNSFSVQNLNQNDQATDTPTNNFCTLNPLSAGGNRGNVITEGATKVVIENSGQQVAVGTIAVSSGKWYWEAKHTSGTYQVAGIISADSRVSGNGAVADSSVAGSDAIGFYRPNGYVYYNGTGTTFDTNSYSNGDIVGVALDMDNGTCALYKNGSIMGNVSGTDIVARSGHASLTGDWTAFYSDGTNGNYDITYEVNFGGYQSYTISSGNSDANGYGNFEYAPPSGYYALCTKNLAEYG